MAFGLLADPPRSEASPRGRVRPRILLERCRICCGQEIEGVAIQFFSEFFFAEHRAVLSLFCVCQINKVYATHNGCFLFVTTTITPIARHGGAARGASFHLTI